MTIQTASVSPEFIAKSITNAIKAELEELIRKRLHAEVDSIVSELAREIAATTMVNATGYLEQVSKSNFGGPAVIIQLSFNNESVTYTPEPKS
jgi:hypothetical protein